MSALRRLLIVAAVIFVGNVVTLSPQVTELAFAQSGPPFTPPGPPPSVPPGRGVPAPLLGAGWPAIAIAGAAFAAYRLRRRKRPDDTDEAAVRSPQERD